LTKKSVEQYEEELRCQSITVKERETSDRLYAIKLVEKIVFGIIWVGILAMVTALISLVLKK
jgi:hypothetical protein